ncbi:MAG: hypothetical protein FWE90_07590 [Defluviitaleaceae bacterium]|nr:hypothetical protein [Defluviitaleaceae bacterium]
MSNYTIEQIPTCMLCGKVKSLGVICSCSQKSMSNGSKLTDNEFKKKIKEEFLLNLAYREASFKKLQREKMLLYNVSLILYGVSIFFLFSSNITTLFGVIFMFIIHIIFASLILIKKDKNRKRITLFIPLFIWSIFIIIKGIGVINILFVLYGISCLIATMILLYKCIEYY